MQRRSLREGRFDGRPRYAHVISGRRDRCRRLIRTAVGHIRILSKAYQGRAAKPKERLYLHRLRLYPRERNAAGRFYLPLVQASRFRFQTVVSVAAQAILSIA